MRLESGSTETEGQQAIARLLGDLEGVAKDRGLSSVDQLLGAAKAEKEAAEAPKGPEDWTQELFGFAYLAAATDKDGVPIARPEYVKRSCTECYARGYFVETKADKSRRYKPCRCVLNGYKRAAKMAAAVAKIVERAKA